MPWASSGEDTTMSKARPIPEFHIPLGGEQLKELGRFCVVWSQIDTLVTLLMAELTKTDAHSIDIMTGQATTSPRVNMLQKLAKARSTDHNMKVLADICEKMGGLLEKRNHLMHGLWAIYWADNGDTQAASHYSRRRDKPIMASQLVEVTDAAAEFSANLGKILRAISPILADDPGPPRSFFFGPGDPAKKKPPKPLQVLP